MKLSTMARSLVSKARPGVVVIRRQGANIVRIKIAAEKVRQILSVQARLRWPAFSQPEEYHQTASSKNSMSSLYLKLLMSKITFTRC